MLQGAAGNTGELRYKLPAWTVNTILKGQKNHQERIDKLRSTKRGYKNLTLKGQNFLIIIPRYLHYVERCILPKVSGKTGESITGTSRRGP